MSLRAMVFLAALAGASTVSADPIRLQCQLAGQTAAIHLTLQPPRIIHQAAGQAPITVSGKAIANGLSYVLPNKTQYQLNQASLAYTQTLNGKAVQGSCRVLTGQPVRACPTRRPYCKHIPTCQEATRLLEQCGFSELDSDGDGTPCEALCGD